ncbi:trypsin-like peptidase domain-containing protein [Streptomyces sp. bgisy027]|uniref:VMAP-C domain-containing protein n=1 Tax=unclassified Streptomyces TaxID=2593676 RepID=UPI003D710C78
MSTSKLDTLATRATVWIGPDDDSGAQWGSGFFITPEWVLTCAHVLLAHGTAEQAGSLRVVGTHGEARARAAYQVDAGADPEDDLMLLRLFDGPRPSYCVRLTDRIDTLNSLTAYGHYVPRAGAAPQEWSGHCEVEALHGSFGLALGGPVIPPGTSGGPVLDRDRGVVSGLIKARWTNRPGGLAVATTALRRFEAAAPVGDEDSLGADPYRALIRAHDQWHEEHAASSSTSWVAAQEQLCGANERWSARDSATASALLAELPPPASTDELVAQVGKVLRERNPLWPGTVPPRDWRDGHGWLYEAAEGDDLAFLHYLLLVGLLCKSRRPASAAALLGWVKQRAERLPGSHRALLDLAKPTVLPAPTGGADEAGGTGPVVLLELRPDMHHPRDRFHWRVWTWQDDAEHPAPGPQSATDDGDALQVLPYVLSEPLREAFEFLDTDVRRARLEVVLPVEHFDLDVHLWRCQLRARSSRPQPGERLFGVHRQVVLRCARRGPHAEAWQRRWHGDGAQSLKALPLSGTGPERAALRDAPSGVVPVLCRTAADSAAFLREVITQGYGLALWSREAHHTYGCTPYCHDLHRHAERLLRDTGRATALPEELRLLRERISEEESEANWADPLALMYDDPRRPLPERTRRLRSP